ncbi:MAG: UpxY family transcription antiterminator [Sedimentisphaerales bacterium]|nr:UpxY family transcription antiterminator [Sedimentisphaerales bacterium]
MLKASENPPVIWPENGSVRLFEGLWWVAHTKSRNEKALARQLVRHHISYFLPMAHKINRHKGRILRSFLPLFSGYLFFCGTEKDRINVLQTNRVANLIEVKDQQKLLDELYQIEQAFYAGANLIPQKYIKTGQLCRVKAGPLCGLEGQVLRDKKISRLVLQIDMLGQSASVEIDNDLIEVVEK